MVPHRGHLESIDTKNGRRRSPNISQNLPEGGGKKNPTIPKICKESLQILIY
jgi:hypothetical protein